MPSAGTQIPTITPAPPAISRNASNGIRLGLTPTDAIEAMMSGTFFNFAMAEPIEPTAKSVPRITRAIFIYFPTFLEVVFSFCVYAVIASEISINALN